MNVIHIPKKIVTKRKKVAYLWEHYVMPEVEIASSVLVLVVDTFGWIHIPSEHSLIVHQFSSTGCLAFMAAHLIRRYKEYRKKHHAPINNPPPTADTNCFDCHDGVRRPTRTTERVDV